MKSAMRPVEPVRIGPRRGLRFLATELVMTGFLATLISLPLRAQADGGDESLRFEDYLPSNCYALALFEGMHAAGRHVDEQALFEIWDESEIQAFIDPALGEVLGQLDAARDEERPGGLPLTRMWQLFGGRLGVAAGGMASVNSIPMPAMLAGLDVSSGGASTADVEAFLEQWLDQLPGDVRDGFIRGTFDYRGIHVKTVGSATEQWEVCYTSLGNLFVAGTSRYYLIDYLGIYLQQGRQWLGSVQGSNPAVAVGVGGGIGSGASLGAGAAGAGAGGESGRLVDLPSYQRAWQRLGGSDPVLWVHVNMQAIKPILGFIPPVRGLMNLLGISGINALTVASHLEGPGSRELIYVDAPGQREGLVWLAEPGPVDMNEIGWAPPQSMVCAAIPCRFSEAYRDVAAGLKGGVLSLLPPDMRGQIDKMIDQFLLWVPLNVMGDLLEPLGDTASFFVAPSSMGSPVPDLGLTVRLANPWRFETALERLLSILPPNSLRITKYQEKNIYYASVRTPSGPMQVAFTMLADRLLVANQVMSLKKLVQWAASPDRVLLRETPDFEKSLASLGGGAGYLTYVNVPMLVAGFWQQFAPGLPSIIENQGLPLDPESVPSVATIVSHLRGVMVSYSADDGGLLFELTSPAGLASLIECAGAAAGWVFREGYGEAIVTLIEQQQQQQAQYVSRSAAVPSSSAGSVPPSQPGFIVREQVTRPNIPAGSPTARAVLDPRDRRMSGLISAESRIFDVRSDLADDVRARLIAEAESAWDAACDLIGVSKTRGGGRSPLLILVKDQATYNELGAQVADHDDAVKSSTFPAFCDLGESSNRATACVLFDLNEDYTRCMVRHAAAELAVRTCRSTAGAPRWLIEGVACYVSRYHTTKLAAWSIDSLMNEGGPIALESFFHPFTISRQTVLEAGLLVAFLNDGQASRDVRYTWADVKAILAGGGGEMSSLVGRLETLLEEHAYELDEYVSSVTGEGSG